MPPIIVGGFNMLKTASGTSGTMTCGHDRFEGGCNAEEFKLSGAFTGGQRPLFGLSFCQPAFQYGQGGCVKQTAVSLVTTSVRDAFMTD